MNIIKTNADYQTALVEVERLIDADPKPGTEAARNLELMAILVDEYESRTFSLMEVDPVEAIEFRMEQQDLAPRDLIPFIGSRSKVSEILSRKRPLTLSMIRALNEGLGIPAKVLIQEGKGSESEDQPEWDKFPIREIIARGWIDDTAEAVRGFFEELPSTLRAAVLYRKTEHIRSARSMDNHALTAWTARVLLRARNESLNGNYKAGTITLDFMRELAHRSLFEHGPVAAKDFLSEHGIALIIEPHLAHTYLDGAAILFHINKPAIGMSIRYDRLDNFWFTLMHEVAHISLHSGAGPIWFIDDLDVDAKADPKEREADDLAANALVPSEIWKTSPLKNLRSPEAAQRLAKQIGVHPAIVAGWMRHEWNAFRLLNNLVGHREVRKEFGTISWPE